MNLMVTDYYPTSLVFGYFSQCILLTLESPHAAKHVGVGRALDESPNTVGYKRIKFYLHHSSPLIRVRSSHSLRIRGIVSITAPRVIAAYDTMFPYRIGALVERDGREGAVAGAGEGEEGGRSGGAGGWIARGEGGAETAGERAKGGVDSMDKS